MRKNAPAMPTFWSTEGYDPTDQPVDLRNIDVLVPAFRDPENYTPKQMAAARAAACLLARREWPFTQDELAELVFPYKASATARAKELETTLHGDDGLLLDVRTMLRKEGCDVRLGRYLPKGSGRWQTVYAVESVEKPIDAQESVVSAVGVLEWSPRDDFEDRQLPPYATLVYQAAQILTAHHAQVVANPTRPMAQ